LVLASVITLVALPTIWLANRNEGGSSSSRPNVAAVGIDPGQADAPESAAAGFDPMGTSGAAYLEPLASAVTPSSVAVVTGTASEELIATARASFRRTSVQFDTCEFNGVASGQEVIVVNVANGRSTTCTIVREEGLAEGELLLSQGRFQRIAELIAAPIHVEIRK
jgi:hypothetical protein